jgi:hypothetical protein
MKLRAPLLMAALLAGGCQFQLSGASSGSQDPNALERAARPFDPQRLTLYERFQSEDPSDRMEAAIEAGRWRDRKSVPYLVDRLTDSEPEVRFAAIHALQRITGTTRGYRYYKSSAERGEAVRRWRQWLAGGRATGQPASRPASRPAGEAT